MGRRLCKNEQLVIKKIYKMESWESKGSRDPRRTLARGATCPLSGRAVLCSLDMPLDCVPLRLRRDVASTLPAGTRADVPRCLHTCACCTPRNENGRGSKISWKSHQTKTMHVDNREMRICVQGDLSDKSRRWQGRRCLLTGKKGSRWCKTDLTFQCSLKKTI